MPTAIADQVDPFQRVTAAVTAPLRVLPATRSPFVSTVSACTSAFTPAPSADQLVPSQRATRLALTPPALVKSPPATRSPFGSIVRHFTSLFAPRPSADQFVPSQRAT